MNAYEMKQQQQNVAAVILSKSDRPERKLWEQLLIRLDDEILIECYHDAVEMKLEEDFIELLKKEIELRGIEDRTFVAEAAPVQDLQNV